MTLADFDKLHLLTTRDLYDLYLGVFRILNKGGELSNAESNHIDKALDLLNDAAMHLIDALKLAETNFEAIKATQS